MLDPYKMVYLNTIVSVIMLLGFFVYKYIFPKKNISLFFIFLLISILPIISIFRIGDYESGDFNTHIYRTMDFYKSLTEGHFFPSWAASLNATYGYPLFIFNYPLPYYILSFFHLLGFSYISSMKIFLATNLVFSGIFMYMCSRKIFRNELAAFTTAIFYQFAPYHLISIHYKITIGEIMIFTILPTLFLFLQKLWHDKNKLWLPIASILAALLIMSHVVLALFCMGIIFMYSLFLGYFSKSRYPIFSTTFVFILGSLSSVYIWMTPFLLGKYTIISKVPEFTFNIQPWELLFSPWRLGLLYQGPYGEISLLLGYTHIFIVIALIYLLFQHKIQSKYRNTIIFWLSLFFGLVFFTTKYSEFLWRVIPFLKSTGGSHRLILLITFVSSILAGYFSIYIQKKSLLFWLLIGFTVFSTILNWGHRNLIPYVNDQSLKNTIAESTSKGEGHWYANSKWRNMKDPWFKYPPKSHLEIVKGSSEIIELQRLTTKHSYIISSQNDVRVRDNTLYFPGWNAYDNNKLISTKPDDEGVISFKITKGLHYVQVIYDDLLVYKTLKTISVIVFFGLVFYTVFLLIKLKKFNPK